MLSKIKIKNKFSNIIHHYNNGISKKLDKVNKTFLRMENYILNALQFEYSNGIVEGTNNLIKQIKT